MLQWPEGFRADLIKLPPAAAAAPAGSVQPENFCSNRDSRPEPAPTTLEIMRSVRDLFLVFGAGHTMCSPNTRVPRFVQPHARSAHHNSARVGTRVQSTLVSRA